MDHLPDEVMSCIFEFLNICDLYGMTGTNSYYSHFRPYRIRVVELNKKRQHLSGYAMHQKQSLILLLFHHKTDRRCLETNPDLHITKQKNLKMLYTFLEKPNIPIEKIIHKGFECYDCLRNFVQIEKKIHNLLYRHHQMMPPCHKFICP